MKSLISWMVLAFILAVGVMPAIHWRQTQNVEKSLATAKLQSDRLEMTNNMILELEKYRRVSSSFRKMSEPEISAAKSQLRDSFKDTIARLEKMSPDASEKALAEQSTQNFNDLQVVSAKLEPTLFSRNVYQKSEVTKLHDGLVNNLTQIANSARLKMRTFETGTSQDAMRSLQLMILAAIAAAAMLALVIFRDYLTLSRPLARLKKRILDIREGKIQSSSPQPEAPKPLRGDYGIIESVMKDLAATVEMQRTERHQFITAVAMDLRAPLVKLQTGVNFLSSVGERMDENQRHQAVDLVKRSLFRLSRSLDDLNDIIDTDTQIRLDEKILDLRSVLNQVADALGGASSPHQITVSAPSMPIWCSADPQRIERVLVNLVSKMIQFQPQGGRTHVSLTKPSHGSFRGVEITIQDGDAAAHRTGIASGPETDLLRHWVSENGFGMSLAHKIIKAHGGMITASGVAGTRVMFTIRIPQERVASGLMSSSLSPTSAGALEMNRVQAMFPKEAVHFGS